MVVCLHASVSRSPCIRHSQTYMSHPLCLYRLLYRCTAGYAYFYGVCVGICVTFLLVMWRMGLMGGQGG